MTLLNSVIPSQVDSWAKHAASISLSHMNKASLLRFEDAEVDVSGIIPMSEVDIAAGDGAYADVGSAQHQRIMVVN